MNRRFIRRNRVDELKAAAIAAAAAGAATLSSASPTGGAVTDAVVVFLAVWAVVWAAASAPWWALAGIAGFAAVIALEPVLTIVAALGFLGGLYIGSRKQDLSEVRSVVAGVAVNCLIRSELDEFFGLSAILGVVAGLALAAVGLWRRPSRIRRHGFAAAGAAVAFLGVALAMVAIAGSGARPDVVSGAQLSRDAVSRLNDGDYRGAAELLERAAGHFDAAGGRLGGGMSAPGRIVPAVAQNLRAGAVLSSAAAESAGEAAAALRQVDVSSLAVSGGRVDLGAIRRVQEPLERVEVAFKDLRDALQDAASPWLLAPIRDELDELDAEFAANQLRLDNALDAVELAPQMLGGERSRRYLLLFTSPSEARGLGGFVGSFAVLEVDNGVLGVSDFGRTSELNMSTAGADCSGCDPELLERYGAFGFTTGEGGGTGAVLFSNITMPAHFPYVAEAAQDVYSEREAGEIDGVLVLDPYVVQALMQYSGPIPVPALDTVVQPDDAAQFLLEDQYILAEDKGVRVEALDALGTGAIAAVLTGSLPDPPTVARDLGPLVAERRLLMWTDDAEEQALLDRVGLLGSIPQLDERDGGFSVSVSNASANKIDVFLDRDVTVEVVERVDGRELIARVTLTNNAPSSGLPGYVIGNVLGEPDGTSRLYVTFYGVPELSSITANGEPFSVGGLPEAGWMGFSSYVTLLPGEQRDFTLTFELGPRGPGEADVATPTVWTQPLAER